MLTQRFPIPAFESDPFASGLGPTLPLFMTLAWLYTVSLTIKSVVWEKEQNLDVIMHLRGLSGSAYWCSWLVTALLTSLPSVGILTLLLKLGNILRFTDGLVLFLFLETFVLSSLLFAMLISVFFRQAKIASAVGGILYFCLYIPFVIVALSLDTLPVSSKYGASTLSTTAFGIGVYYMAHFEQLETGVQWSSLHHGIGTCDQFSVAAAWGMLCLDCLLYAALSWYF
ncbi:uncharacterized protein MONBRDRAFT_15907, partial [Monosiga brevicollis MX1]